MKTIAVVGLGYIGLPTAIVSAQSGCTVLGFDVDTQKVDKINKAISPIIEKGIEEKLENVIFLNKLKATTILNSADVFIIAVPTPFESSDPEFLLESKLNETDFVPVKAKKADLSYVFSAAKEISKVLKKGDLIILESTIPVGTTRKIAEFLEKESGLNVSKDFYISHCPERVLPGAIFEELISNDRIIGGICHKSSQLSKEFYSTFVKGELYLTDDKTAEMAKLSENAYRDLNIAFANQISEISNSVGINPFELIELTNKHPRVNILNPGCGVGGHCIAVDPWFLIETFPKKTSLLQKARNINDAKPFVVIKNVLDKILLFDVKPKILTLGLTFKANVDDLRGSPALFISEELNKKKNILDLAVLEPNLEQNVLDSLGFKSFNELQLAVEWADLIVILVNHDSFMKLKECDLKAKVIIDESGLMYKIAQNDDTNFISDLSIADIENRMESR